MRLVGRMMQWILISLLLCCGLVQANTDGTVFLERGQRGIVSCPLVKSCEIPIEDIAAMYWYYGSTSDTSLLISYFFGRVAPQNGIPEGVYDIDKEFSLVIENVTASNEGTYYFQVKPRLKMVESGSVEVCDKVSPSRPYPNVLGCNQHHDADTCEVRAQQDSTVHNLTCVMEQVKPAVQLRWIRLFLGGLTELNASTTVRPVVLPAYTGSSLRNNTYSTSASVQVTAVDDEEVYACEAMGVVVGKGTRMIVRFTKTYDEVQSSNNQGSSLKTNTHSTSASVQVAAADDNDVYVCLAVGGVVEKETCINVRLAKTRRIATTATYDKVQSSNNPGTTLVLTDEVTPTSCTYDLVLIISVLALVSIAVIVYAMSARLHKVCLKKKRNENIRASEMESQMSLKTASSDC